MANCIFGVSTMQHGNPDLHSQSPKNFGLSIWPCGLKSIYILLVAKDSHICLIFYFKICLLQNDLCSSKIILTIFKFCNCFSKIFHTVFFSGREAFPGVKTLCSLTIFQLFKTKFLPVF